MFGGAEVRVDIWRMLRVFPSTSFAGPPPHAGMGRIKGQNHLGWWGVLPGVNQND